MNRLEIIQAFIPELENQGGQKIKLIVLNPDEYIELGFNPSSHGDYLKGVYPLVNVTYSDQIERGNFATATEKDVSEWMRNIEVTTSPKPG